MSEAEKRKAWAAFWRDGEASGSSGCFAGSADKLGAARAEIWLQFARSLPRRAHVLDLGTGDGVVLKQVRKGRPDLRLIGVDSAPDLPSQGAGLTLKAGVAMEALPFRDECFDAITSQFGYEYGSTAEAAREVARVLKAKGRFLFVIHHAPGPVVAHNLARAEAIRWAAIESGYLERARSLATARRTAMLPTPPIFGEALSQATQRFPRQDVAAVITRGIVQAVDPRSPPEESLTALGWLEQKARFELTRIEALAAAARDEAGMGRLAGELGDAGLDIDKREVLPDRYGQPFAWLVAGTKPSGRGTSR